MTDIITQIKASHAWAIQQPGFLGSARQLTDCAKCGAPIRKGRHEPRHAADIFKPTFHYICDGCYDALPDPADD